MKKSNTHPSNQSKQTRKRRNFQGESPSERADERGYVRHVLPRGIRAIRRYGFCHPAAKAKRERIAFHTGRPLLIGALELPPPRKPAAPRTCPCCGTPMLRLLTIPAAWQSPRAPPPVKRRCA